MADQQAVGLDGEVAAVRQDLQVEPFAAGQEHRAVERGMRGHGGDQQPLRVGGDDRPAGGEAVRGGAGRRGDDDRVGGVGHEGLALDPYGDRRGLVSRAAQEHDVIERRLLGAPEAGVDAGAGLQREPVGVDGIEGGRQFRYVDLGEEAQASDVDPQDRRVAPGREPHGAQHGAVPAEADQQVGARGHLLGPDRNGLAADPGHLRRQPQDFRPPGPAPADHGVHGGRAGALGVEDQPHRADESHPGHLDVGQATVAPSSHAQPVATFKVTAGPASQLPSSRHGGISERAGWLGSERQSDGFGRRVRWLTARSGGSIPPHGRAGTGAWSA